MKASSKHNFTSLLFGILCISVLGCSNPTSEQLDYVSGQLLLKPYEKLSYQQVEELTGSYEIVLIDYFEHLGLILVGVPEGQEVAWKEKLEKDNLIESASLVSNKVTYR